MWDCEGIVTDICITNLCWFTAKEIQVGEARMSRENVNEGCIIFTISIVDNKIIMSIDENNYEAGLLRVFWPIATHIDLIRF